MSVMKLSVFWLMISSCSLLADHGWLLRFPSFIHSYIPQSLSPHRSATCLSPSGHCAQWHSYISTLFCLSFLRSPDTCHLVKNKDPATQSLFIIPPTNTLEWMDKYSFRSDTASASVRKQTESNCFLKTKPSLSLFLSFFFIQDLLSLSPRLVESQVSAHDILGDAVLFVGREEVSQSPVPMCFSACTALLLAWVGEKVNCYPYWWPLDLWMSLSTYNRDSWA